MEKWVWRVKVAAETGSGPPVEVEVAPIAQTPYVQIETLGLTLDEGKRIAAAVEREVV